MVRMLNLIKNENMKLYHRVSTWVMAIILIIVVIAVGLIIKYAIPDDNNNTTDWKAQLTEQNLMYEETLNNPSLPEYNKNSAEKGLKINNYKIDNNIPPIENSSLWGFVKMIAPGCISLISLFTIIVAGGIVANEFSKGTIKLLLIRPYKRWKILTSKYLSVLLYCIFMIIILFIISFITGGLLFGFKGVSQPYIAYYNGNIHEVNMVAHVFGVYGLSCINLLMMVSFAFMISTVFRNSALSIGLAIFLTFVGSNITAVLAMLKVNWAKYILFANTDLTQYIDGIPLIDGMTMQFSIIVLIIYFLLFNSISYIGFKKRDVAA